MPHTIKTLFISIFKYTDIVARYFMYDAVKGVPWERCRGIESIDLNDYLILVQAPIEEVAQTFTQLRQVVFWERDVYESEIEISGYSFTVFQFQLHSWTVIRELNFLPYQVPLTDKDVRSFSRLLRTKAICYQISDTGGNIGYHLYDGGESMEKLYFTSEIEGDIDEDEGMEEQGTCHFHSLIRQVKAEDIEDAYKFTDAFLREQDAYVPAFFRLVHFEVGQRITLRIEGLKSDNFVRMDYLVVN